MIVDFQHHFTPRELIRDDPGDRLVLHYDENGAPSYTVHALLYDLDEHIRMMDTAGINLIDPLLKTGDFVPIVQPGIVVNGTLTRRDAFPDIPLATEILDGKLSGTARRAFESWLKGRSRVPVIAFPVAFAVDDVTDTVSLATY